MSPDSVYIALCHDTLIPHVHVLYFFFFNDTATTEIYTLSLHDALPISLNPELGLSGRCKRKRGRAPTCRAPGCGSGLYSRSEEHTSELQSPCNLVCRLLLEKKKQYTPVRLRTLSPHSPPRSVAIQATAY